MLKTTPYSFNLIDRLPDLNTVLTSEDGRLLLWGSLALIAAAAAAAFIAHPRIGDINGFRAAQVAGIGALVGMLALGAALMA